MKNNLIISLLSVMAFSACAGSELTVSDLAKNTQTQALFAQMTQHHSLPEWVTQGNLIAAAERDHWRRPLCRSPVLQTA
jgi:uncharacterized protein YjiK